MTPIQLANLFAENAHRDQFRRDGVTPYVTHPQAVAEMVSERAKPVALLHDVLEDSDFYTEEILRQYFSDEIVAAVVAITRKAGDLYDDYIARVMSNELAREVKIADITHNLNSSPSAKNIEKYKKALAILKKG
jgi:(p)ppGpp synthase/HD superfamily hydrolase